MKIDGARILVTGAAGGIGSAVARQLGRSGARLFLTDVAEAPLHALAGKLRRDSVEVLAVAANLASHEDRAMLAGEARTAGVHVLINVAGINPFGLFVEQSDEEIERAMQINTMAPMLLCHAMIPLLADAARAHIVNVGSTFGSIAYPGFAVYSASKFAIRGFSEALRRELADTGIGVHYVAPRATQTALATDRIRAMNEELKVGMDSPAIVAKAIQNVLETERAECFLGGRERMFAKVNGLLPRLVDRALMKQLPVIRRYAATAAPRLHASPADAAGHRAEGAAIRS